MQIDDLHPEIPNYDPEPADGVHVGESPVPGLTLKRILDGHVSLINKITWSPDGRFLVSLSYDNSIRIWDFSRYKCINIITFEESIFYNVSWAPSGNQLVASSDTHEPIILNTRNWELEKAFLKTNTKIQDVAWSKKNFIASSYGDTIKIEKIYPKNMTIELNITCDDGGTFAYLSWSPNSRMLASVDIVYEIFYIWELKQKNIFSIQNFPLTSEVASFQWSHDNELITLGLHNGNIVIIDLSTMRITHTLKGHTNTVISLSFSANNSLMASKACDGSIRIWNTLDWQTIVVIHENNHKNNGEDNTQYLDPEIAFHPSLPVLATLGRNETVVRIWEIDENDIRSA